VSVKANLSDPPQHREAAPRPIHVRLVTWDDDPPLGGQGVYVRELRSALGTLGVRVSTVAGSGQHAMPYRRLTNRPHLDMSIRLNRDIEVLTTGEPDVIHVSGGPGGIQLLRRLKVPVVYTAHHTFRLSHRWGSPVRLGGLLEARSYREASMVAAVSPSTASSVIEMGVPPAKVVVISPGVNLDKSGVEDSERERGCLLYVGRLEEEKGPLDAVRCMDKVASALPGTHGYVVGSGSMEKKVRVAVASTQGRVTFLGHLSDGEVADLYRRAEVVVMPSAFEGLGMVALEAMASGAVVVGYDVPGLRDTLRGRGLVVPHGDLRALEASVSEVLTSERTRRRLAARSVQHVRAERSWTHCAEQFDDLYRFLQQSSS
jgi:D-inositol-3-phosphate glycosyltransferase